MWPFKKKEEVVTKQDSYTNAVTGLGTLARDKLVSAVFEAGDIIDDVTLEDMYHDSDIAARIADIVPDEMLRKGFEIVVGRDVDEKENAEDVISSLMMKLKDLGTREKLNEAMVWARVFGGSAVLMGADDGLDNSLPINLDRLKDIRFLNVMDKRCLRPIEYFTDPTQPNFGMPRLYEIQATVPFPGANPTRSERILVHESRLLIFDGTRTSQRRKTRNDGWAESIYQKIDEVLKQFSTSYQSAAHLMQDAAQAVFGIEGLVDMIASNDPNTSGAPQLRMQEVDFNRSNARSILIDSARESFSRDSYSFSGVPEVLQKMTLRLAAAAKLPVTILMGQSPAGLNATGESDIRAFYDTIQSAQKNDLKPKLEKLLRVVMASSEGPTSGRELENWDITFPPPWQMSEKEWSEIRKRQAETDGIYIDKGVVTAEEIALSRFTKPGFNPETSVDLDIREELLQEELKKLGEEPEGDQDD